MESLEHDHVKDGNIPIAVIGYSFKFPQEATSFQDFWRMLVEGRSARTEVPGERFNIDAYYHSDGNRLEGLSVRDGHFLKQDLAAFDAPFFSITPTEAAAMDPQQRNLLETTYRAFENAGISMSSAASSKTSVHIGSLNHDWIKISVSDPLMHGNYESTGSELSFLANRLSWFYDLTGPSMFLDTACSSSLLALHLACQSLRTGEASMGLVGGTNLIMSPEIMTSMANMGILSPEGKSYSFDHRANGYARGEGFGIVIIKPLAQALRDGHTIRAVIRATGSNQDGKTPGMTQPNGIAQEQLIRETYKAAGLQRSLTRYFEAHGTGTQVGDPKEAKAIAAAFQDQLPPGQPLYIGAVKTNIGHLEGASGIASLIKTILVLENGWIPRNLWFEKPNPNINETDWNIKFPTENTPWPSEGIRRASINSFGFGGTNVHVVLDDALHYLNARGLNGYHLTAENPSEPGLSQAGPKSVPWQSSADKGSKRMRHKVFVWSAADESGLERLASVYTAHFSRLTANKEPEKYLDDLAFTLASKRSSLRWKSYRIATCIHDLRESLERTPLEAFRPANDPRIAFVFTGQGAQWHGMGRELVDYPVFKESLSDTQITLGNLGCRWLLIDKLWAGDGDNNIHSPTYSQPICTALQIALVDLLLSWGIHPSSVTGHSSGEIAAAYCAGALSKESALRIAYYRGQLAARLTEPNHKPGAMVSVALPEKEVRHYLTELFVASGKEDICIGCVNSPRNITLSGSQDQVNALKSTLDRNEVFSRKLRVNVAYHSKAMDEIACEYRALIADITARQPESGRPTMVSSVTGVEVSTDEVGEADYWVRNMVSQVKFSEAISRLCTRPSEPLTKKTEMHTHNSAITDVIEIGPHSTLQGSIKDTLSASSPNQNISYTSLLVRGVSAIMSSLSAIGRLHSLGYAVNLTAINFPYANSSKFQTLSDLPEYPFNHTKSYWAESRISKNLRFRKHPRHELLGIPVPDWNPSEAKWRHTLRLSENSWIQDHKVNGVVIYPAAGMLVMAIEAARQVASRPQSITGYRLQDVFFKKALISLSSSDDFELQLYLRAMQSNDDGSTVKEFRIFTCDNGKWSEHCSGTIAVEYQQEHDEIDCGREATRDFQLCNEKFAVGAKNCKTAVEPHTLYERLGYIGLSYGPKFQVLSDVRYHDSGAVGIVHLRKWTIDLDEKKYQEHVVHPTALDGVLQLCFPAVARPSDQRSVTMVPERLRNLWLSSHGLSGLGKDCVKAYANTDHRGIRTASCSVLALDKGSGDPRVKINGLEFIAVEGNHGTSSLNSRSQIQPLCGVEWRPDLSLLSHEEVKRYCKATITHAPPDKLIEDVEFMVFSFLSSTLEEIASKNVIVSKPHLIRYLEWMKRQEGRYEKGELIHWRPDWPSLRHDKSHNEEVIKRIESSPGSRLFTETGKNLLGILEGKIDALDVLFSGDLAANSYSEATKHGCKALEPYLDAMVHKEPGLRILEVGAGTGATTEFLLQTLTRHEGKGLGVARYQSYTYTDISPGFFEKARARFGDGSERMKFATLNIEKDPVLQGFGEGEYDLIVAVNVLHATPSLIVTLKNTRKLLKPGGKLILCENHNESITRAEFSFGLLPGWWLSTENARQWGPLLSPEGWHDFLRGSGFSGTDMVFHDFDDPRNRFFNAMISTAEAEKSSSEDLPRTSIIIAKDSDLQLAAALEIRAQITSESNIGCDLLEIPDLPSAELERKVCIFLPEMEKSFLHGITDEDYARLQSIVKSAASIFWVTERGGQASEKPERNMILGLARCLRSEIPNLRIITIALHDTTDTKKVARHVSRIVGDALSTSPEQCESEYEERDGELHVSRVVEAEYLNDYLSLEDQQAEPKKQMFGHGGRALKLQMGTVGLLDSLEYVEDPEWKKPFAQDEVEVKVRTVGVNFKDILTALGRLTDGRLGSECAGIVVRSGSGTDFVSGDRVCVGSATVGTFRTYVRVKATSVFKIPDSMSFATASALPIVFSTAYQALYEIARLTAEDSILVSCGAGGTGQAAIQLARLAGAEIYVTVGSQEKKRLIMDLYMIPEDHIFSSRSLSFIQGIKRMTNERGVDVILNSLAGESLQGSWGCLAPFGRFLEIGKNDILKGNKLPMFPFNDNRTFTGVNLDHMGTHRPRTIQRTMEAILSLAKDDKIHAPQPLHIYGNSQLEEAFRYLQGGKNTGKTIIELSDSDLVSVVCNPKPDFSFCEDKTYLIAGGLGGLGRQITCWMVDRGARHLILLSRSGANNKSARTFLEQIEARAVDVISPACDISDARSLESVLASAKDTMPPIAGCIQATMVLQDSLFETMPPEAFNAAVKPKVDGSWNLHQLLPRGLDFFILLSSTCGIVGLHGQANYAAGNTFQDALARHRISAGQKAVSLDLGMITSFGYVSEQVKVLEALQKLGYPPVREAELLSVLKYHCDPELNLLPPTRSQVIMGLPTPASLKAQNKEELHWMRRTQFKSLRQIGNISITASLEPENALSVATLCSRVTSTQDASEIITKSLLKKLSRLLNMPLEDLDPAKPAHVFGVDSLVAVEVVNWFRKDVNADVKTFEVLGNESISGLSLSVSKRCQYGLITKEEHET